MSSVDKFRDIDATPSLSATYEQWVETKNTRKKLFHVEVGVRALLLAEVMGVAMKELRTERDPILAAIDAKPISTLVVTNPAELDGPDEITGARLRILREVAFPPIAGRPFLRLASHLMPLGIGDVRTVSVQYVSLASSNATTLTLDAYEYSESAPFVHGKTVSRNLTAEARIRGFLNVFDALEQQIMPVSTAESAYRRELR